MLYQQIARNKRKTVVVMAAFVIILTLVGAGFGYLFSNTPWTGIFIALIGSLIYLFLVMRDPANMVMSLNHAQEIHEQDNPQLWHIVEDMAMVGRVPMPRVFIINDPSPNAFATGRDPDHSAVAVTQGLLDMMDREELEGVLGHEISHIRNYDIRLSTIAVVLVGVISFLSGLAEPLGALLGWLVLRPIMNDTVFGLLFAGVAGIMVFISFDELLPAAREYGEHHLSIYGLISGMVVMAVSLLLFL